MTDTTSIARLMTWLSPAFPTGAFAYSHGLESAFEAGLIKSRTDVQNWLATLLTHGSVWNDGVLCAEAWRRRDNRETLAELAEFATALAGSAERHLETTAQGAAFVSAANHWPSSQKIALPEDCPLPVAVGAVAGRMQVPLEATTAAFVHAALSNLVQAVLRLGHLGQQDGVAIIAALEDSVLDIARKAAQSNLDDIGGAVINSEIMAMRHETMEPRIFRS